MSKVYSQELKSLGKNMLQRQRQIYIYRERLLPNFNEYDLDYNLLSRKVNIPF